MNPKNFPVIRRVYQYGAEDWMLDATLLLGPVVILLFVLFGRNPVTVGVVTLYILSFVGYVLYKSATSKVG